LVFISYVVAQYCGSSNYNLTTLGNKVWWVPAGSPCRASVCYDQFESKYYLPWDLYFSFCSNSRSIPSTKNCGPGFVVCQTWDQKYDAALGMQPTVTYKDVSGGLVVSASNGTSVNGQSRSVQITILCGSSSAYPTLIYEDQSTLTYQFVWIRQEIC